MSDLVFDILEMGEDGVARVHVLNEATNEWGWMTPAEIGLAYGVTEERVRRRWISCNKSWLHSPFRPQPTSRIPSESGIRGVHPYPSAVSPQRLTD